MKKTMEKKYDVYEKVAHKLLTETDEPYNRGVLDLLAEIKAL